MATVVIETGEGLANANAYVDALFVTAYAESRLNSTAWASASDEVKVASIIQAARLIDARIQPFNPKLSYLQALNFPTLVDGLPAQVKEANAELAIQLLTTDYNVDEAGGGAIVREKVDVIEVQYSDRLAKRRPKLPTIVVDLLRPFGSLAAGSARLKRV